ncbi:nucleotidyltransferase domain-containing protein [Pectobacterium punjabense]|uniref:nucleotidyltransferase domain-containing protein n=1 Tax=Pectobacterium punjabense TaxID=2108399 RepID=UPI0024055503|nr:nucleotidyltransferase domain-containing protein [Pectobacterium punjabense]MDG0799291.1 nucleotidyltransferase domain-containing protein [Pectobacterium punjabense]
MLVGKPEPSHIYQLIKEKYPSVSLIFIHGSYTTGRMHHDSDIDVIAIFNDNISPFREHVKLSPNDFIIDLFCYDIQTIYFEITNSQKRDDWSLAKTISKSISYPENDEISKKIKETASDIIKNPTLINNNTIKRHYLSISNTIKDLELSQSRNEKIIISTSLIQHIINLSLSFHKENNQKGKHIVTALIKTSPKLYAEICNAHIELVNNDSANSLIKISREFINGLPIENPFYEKIHLPLKGRLPLD